MRMITFPTRAEVDGYETTSPTLNKTKFCNAKQFEFIRRNQESIDRRDRHTVALRTDVAPCSCRHTSAAELVHQSYMELTSSRPGSFKDESKLRGAP